ncbi:MAG: tetratricopeptide repeat protein [Planctomycetota bacterium]|jgi:tetratricopeptide (TPR) repeat protein|nr:tetratricopeptide repeat protein [Planctomycetota bacterium]
MTNASGRFANLEVSRASGPAGPEGGVPIRDAAFYMRSGLARELDGDHEKALADYSAALGENPLYIPAWARQLWMLLYLGETEEAAIWADRALASFPNDPDLLALKSLARWRAGFPEEARRLNDAALAATRESAEVWLARGGIQTASDVKSANACFRHAAAVSREPGLAEMRAGDLLLLNGKPAEALSYCREATLKLPDSAWAWYAYGLAQRGLGRTGYARSALIRAVNLNPRDPRYRAALRRGRGWLSRLGEWLAKLGGR